MIFSNKFVSATLEKSTTKKSVAAPYLRRTLVFDKIPQKAEITVCGLGFYELYVNGKRVTKGHMSPYVVNPDQVLPYDNYDLTELMVYGENVFAFILGNGMQNSFDGFMWDFQKARWNSAPKLAFALELEIEGVKSVIEADEQLLCHPSPLYFDGYRMGEKYDARKIIPDWNGTGCDTSDWTPAIPVQRDCGEAMLACNKPIVDHSMAEMDCTIATTQMMLAAQSLGVGSCWICAFDVPAMAAAFDLPENLTDRKSVV